MKLLTTVCASLFAGVASAALAVDYQPKVKGFSAEQIAQEASAKTLFVDKAYKITMQLTWTDQTDSSDYPVETDYMYITASAAGMVFNFTRLIPTDTVGLPGEIVILDSYTPAESGAFEVSGMVSLKSDFEVALHPDDWTYTSDGSKTIQVIGSGVAILPLIVIFLTAIITRRVEVALGIGIWVGAAIIEGSFVAGFKATLDNYILKALTDSGHVYVILFTLFLSGLVGLMEKSGGINGLTELLGSFAKGPRIAQVLSWFSGFLLFFDDYANCLVVGGTMRPITDLLHVSREKLAFIVDATAAPVAAVVPISSWVAFEVGLIQDQLDDIKEANNDIQPIGLTDSGFVAYINSMPWRFYPFLMMAFQGILILLQREFGPMLTAERKCRVQQRTDGGDGAVTNGKELADHNKPAKSTPRKAFNMLVPIGFLVAFILHEMIKGGKDSVSESKDFEEMGLSDYFQAADPFNGLLFGTMGASIVSMIFYALQFKEDGSITHPFTNLKAYITFGESTNFQTEGVTEEDDDETTEARPVLYFSESIDAWLHGLLAIFPSIVILTLAWGAAQNMQDIGGDRLFAEAIVGNINPDTLPTLTFILSFLIALSTGTSWGTLSIMTALILVPSYRAIVAVEGRSFANPTDEGIALWFGVEAAILSGAVAGDHSSLISDTSVLAATATQCDLTKHVITQIWYVLFVGLWSILLGYLPAGAGAYPAGVGILLGILVMIPATFLLGAPILPASGRFDIVTELYMKINKSSELHQLKQDTIDFVATNPELETKTFSCRDSGNVESVSAVNPKEDDLA